MTSRRRFALCPESAACFAARSSRGFTLIEVMITVAIVGILVAVAYPSYRDYIVRGRLVDGTNALATFKANMERYFQDNRTYLSTGTFVSPCLDTVVANRTFGSFVVTCDTVQPLSATTFKLLATASSGTPVYGFVYSITNDNVQATVVPTGTAWNGWNSCTSAWIVKKGPPC